MRRMSDGGSIERMESVQQYPFEMINKFYYYLSSLKVTQPAHYIVAHKTNTNLQTRTIFHIKKEGEEVELAEDDGENEMDCEGGRERKYENTKTKSTFYH